MHWKDDSGGPGPVPGAQLLRSPGPRDRDALPEDVQRGPPEMVLPPRGLPAELGHRENVHRRGPGDSELAARKSNAIVFTDRPKTCSRNRCSINKLCIITPVIRPVRCLSPSSTRTLRNTSTTLRTDGSSASGSKEASRTPQCTRACTKTKYPLPLFITPRPI